MGENAFPVDESILQEFIAESLEHLEGIDSDLVEYEKDPENRDLIDSVFRAIHSIKGASRFLELHEISQLTHRLETLLDQLRNGERSPDNEIMDLLLRGCDLVKSLIGRIGGRETQDDGRIKGMLSSLDTVIHGKGGDSRDQGSPQEHKMREKTSRPTSGGKTRGYEITEKMIRDFQVEAFELLESCDAALIALDRKRDDRDAVNDLFRAIHSIKGTSAYLGQEDITNLSHALESLLEKVRRRADFRVSDFLLDLFFRAVDCLQAMVSSPEDTRVEKTGREILQLLIEENEEPHGDGGGSVLETPEGFSSTDPNAIFLDAASQHLDTMKACLEKVSEKGCFESGEQEVLLRAVRSLKGSANYMGFDGIEKESRTIEELLQDIKKGELPFAPAITDLIGETIGAIEKHMADLGRGYEDEVCRQERPEKGKTRENLREAQAGKDSEVHERASSPLPALQAPAKTMRIDQRLLDLFMNLVGELIVARNALAHVSGQLDLEPTGQGEIVKGLQKTTQTITRISNEMQRNVMEMRMVPVRNVFQKLSRIVRDAARKTGKKVELILQGEDTEIDKGIAEDIGDPLVHIIRNAVDHGIETPDVRVKAGKPEEGTIVLRASHEGNFIVIDVIDDGAGIDPRVILNKAIENGMLSPEKAGKMREEDIFNLIFMPGFSTAREVTDISGRGVGMDVVRTNLNKLKGSVKVKSEKGQGTHIQLQVPLTLALIEAMLVGVGGSTYAIPVEAIRETVKVRSSEIKSLMKKMTFTHRGDVIGVEMLSRLVDTSGNGGRREKDKEILVLILQSGSECLGVGVDRLYRKEEIIVKPLADYLAGLPGIAGASILGDGETILILEPVELIAMARNISEFR